MLKNVEGDKTVKTLEFKSQSMEIWIFVWQL